MIGIENPMIFPYHILRKNRNINSDITIFPGFSRPVPGGFRSFNAAPFGASIRCRRITSCLGGAWRCAVVIWVLGVVPQWAVKTLSWCVYNSNFTSWFMVDIENTTIPSYMVFVHQRSTTSRIRGAPAPVFGFFWEIPKCPGFWKGNADYGRSPGSNRWRYLLRSIFLAIWIVVIFTEI